MKIRDFKCFVSVLLCCLLLLTVPSVNANHRVSGSAQHHHMARHHHNHHHHGRARKIAAVAAPIGIGAAFGPAGSIGYQGFKHRRAIKHRLVRHGGS